MTDERIFVVLCHDRHVDPVVHVFRDREQSLAYAWECARENARHWEFIQEEASPYLLYIRYSVEADDFVRVEETALEPFAALVP